MTKKLIALLLALVLVFTLAACNSEDEGKNNNESTTAGDGYVEEPTLSDEENTVHYLLINYAPTMDDDFYLEVKITNGEVIAEMNGEIHKVGKIDEKILFDIEEEMIKVGIMDLVGTDTYDDTGESIGSVYMEYTDGDQLMINFNGNVPEAFITAYAEMEKYFTKLLKDAPDYVPEPAVDEDADEAQTAILKEIVTKANLEDLDSYKIYPIAKDENTLDTLGLDSTEFMVSATGCDSKKFDAPYSLVIIQVSGEENVEAVRADLADSLRWDNWVHVPVTSALIAHKGDLVLCLMSNGDAFKATAQAVANSGWQSVIEYKN